MTDESKNQEEEITLTVQEAASLRLGFDYCPRCQTKLVDKMVYGMERRFCENCRFVQFIDPKVGAAVLAVRDGEALLVKRSVEPAMGSWCLPGGFMEMWETPIETAIRECKEETGFDINVTGLVDVFYYENYRGSGVLIVYTAEVIGGAPQAADDAEEVGFFAPNALPDNIEFESNVETLERWKAGEFS